MAKILAVEDEFLVRIVVVETLQGEGHELLDAANGEEALSLVREDAHIDILLTDVRMPGVDGFTLALAARELRPNLSVIFMTGYSDANPPPALTGAKTLRKPFAPEELVSAVSAVLAHR